MFGKLFFLIGFLISSIGVNNSLKSMHSPNVSNRQLTANTDIYLKKSADNHIFLIGKNFMLTLPHKAQFRLIGLLSCSSHLAVDERLFSNIFVGLKKRNFSEKFSTPIDGKQLITDFFTEKEPQEISLNVVLECSSLEIFDMLKKDAENLALIKKFSEEKRGD